MKVLIRQTRVISASSPFNGQIKDILITDGKISRIGDRIDDPADQVIDSPGSCTSKGWTDIFAQFGDPGFEYCETLRTGAAAAAAGGFTDVLIVPNTNPTVHNKSQVEYILSQSADLPVTLHPIGAITRNTEGKALSELFDMQLSGAVAFSDGLQPVQSPGLLLKALQYVRAFDGILIQLPDDASIAPNGLMNEGIVSTTLGLPGKPAIAEELMIARDIELLRYTGSRLHITGVSTQKGLELIAAAKKEGLNISCSVTPYHCAFCDEDLQGYDTNLKVNPPLRNRNDMMALREGVRQGIADCFASHHLPQDPDHKICEFEYARNGMTGLETLFAVVNTLGFSMAEFVENQTDRVRKIFNLPNPEIAEGSPAKLTIFNPDTEYVVEPERMRSKSKNTAFGGKTLKGKVIAIINKNKVQLAN